MTQAVLAFLLATSTPGAPGASGASEEFDHAHKQFTEVLKTYVRDGVVNYAGLRKDRSTLDAYVGGLESVTKKEFQSWSDDQKIGFWLNAYNAYTLKLVIDNKPVTSIKKLGTFWTGVFSKEFIPLKNLFGKTVSLNAIEHDTLRKKFNEPRIHFALVCASKSCPPLRSEAYRATDLNKQLDDQASTFLKDTSKNRFDAKSNTVHLSKIFDWFDDDFEKSKGSVRDYVAQYLTIPSNVRIRHLSYDWTLNGK